MVSIDWTLAIQIVNFLVLIFILNSILYKPIRAILLQRKAKIEGLESGISASTAEVADKDRAFTDGIKQARAKGQKEKEELLQNAADEERAIIAKINAKAQEDLTAVKAKIAQDTQAVKVALEKEVDAFANAITQKILGRTA
jgi:F-type H+-transporting ATPase subunit b